MTIKREQKIPLFVLILLLIWFFRPEFHLLYNTSRNLVNNLCTNCTKTYINPVEQPQRRLQILDQMPIYFETNLKIDDIDLKNSRFDVYQWDFSLIPDTEGKPNPFSQYTRLRTEQIEISNLTKTKNGTKITYIYDHLIDKYFSDIFYVYLTDTDGKTYFQFNTGYKMPSGIELFISRYSYLLQYLLWYLAIFGKAIMGYSWSIVYNSKSKQPLLGSIVRIFKDKELYKTLVTGPNGIVNTKLDKGNYRIQVAQPNFSFPSNLAPQTTDGRYKNLYYGQILNIQKNKTTLEINIPQDPKEFRPPTIIEKASSIVLSTIDSINIYLIALFSISQLLVWPTYKDTWIALTVGGGLIGMQLVLKKRFEGSLGVVVDQNEKRIPNIKINLYDAQWNKLAQSTTSDSKGEYQFLAENKQYYLSIDSGEYKITNGDKITIKPNNDNEILRVNTKIKLTSISQNPS